jgi:integrase
MMHELTDAEFEELLASIDTETAIRDRLMTGCTYYTGLAPKEVVNLHYEDFCDVNGELCHELSVTTRGCSGKQPRRIPLVPPLPALLMNHVRNDNISYGPLFYTIHGAPMTPGACKVQLFKIYQAAGFPNASAFSGRRSFGLKAGRALKTADRSEKDLAAIMGLRQFLSAKKYLDVSGEQLELLNATRAQDSARASGIEKANQAFGR